MTSQQHYEQVQKLSRDTRILQGIFSLLDWDQETYMPADAAGIRAEQRKLIAGLSHKGLVGRPFTNALSKLIDLKTGRILSKKLSEPQQASLRMWRRDYTHAKALPKSFVEEEAELSSQSMNAWHHAKQDDAFQQFAPFLEKQIALARKKAEYLGYKDHPYNALLDQYEPGATCAEINALFTPLRAHITKLVKTVQAKPPVDDNFLFGKFPYDSQMKFGLFVLDAMKYDLKKGRLDISGHPFSSSAHPYDSRITTRIDTTSVMSNVSAVMHEAGHAFYEMGLPVEQYGTPLGDAISLGMHESQSRWWETRIGLSKPFWNHFLPHLQQHFKGKFDHISLDQFYRAINKVIPCMIRIESDEVTYGLHIILRYELELALIEGSLSVRDLPEAWNAKMKELLGLTPKSNREGCLQDIHWSMGAFGYFPTYTLGNLYAGHLFQAFERDHTDWEKRVAKGDLSFIKEWLTQSVHQYGRQYSSKELLLKVTGKPFTADAYTKYLTKKHG
ncbi:MAG: carboxypeptidase M32 [Parachlamydiaceae bacterium]|nr:carboxypeptidase M32 [Parachlamydiaceae bacterium]